MQQPPVNLLPHSREAEQSLIGALLLANDAFDHVSWLQAEDFYADGHRILWRTLRRMLDGGRPADLVTIAEELKQGGELDKAGGPAYIAALAQNTPSALNARRYAELVRDKAIKRKIVHCGQEVIDASFAGARPAREIAEEFEAKALAVLDDEVPDEIDLQTVLMRATDAADDARRIGRRAIETGFRDLDAKLGGLTPGSLTILAARTSVGKTALALNIAEQVAARQPVAFFSLEMGRDEIADRLLASSAAVPQHAIRGGRLDDEQVNMLAEHASHLGQRRLLLDDRSAVTLGDVRARCRRWKRKHGLGLVIVDYLQLMRGEGDTREQEVSSLSRGLKAIAKQLHVPVIALCQLNRQLEGRHDKRPQLYDLRESGAIEQDADIVLMLYREDLHDEETPNRGLCLVLVRKHRNGPLGEVTLRYVPDYCRFESTERRFQSTTGPNRPRGGLNADD